MKKLPGRQLIVFLALAVTGMVAYRGTLDAPFAFDDVANITKNSGIRMKSISFEALQRAVVRSPSVTRPVANLSFAFNYWLGGYSVRGYHLVNIAIHIICGWLVYLTVLRTLQLATGRSEEASHQQGIAAAVALLWLLHPAQTQAVTYIVQRMTAMSVMFYLAALLLYLRARMQRGRRPALLVAAAAGAWLLALGSKQIAITLPALILLYEIYFFRDLDLTWIRRYLPYLVGVVVVVGIIAFVYLGGNPLERFARGYEKRDFTMLQRQLTQFRVLVFYLTLVLLPLPGRFTLDRFVATSTSLFSPITTIVSLLFLLGLLALAVILARRQRLLSFCILWYFLHLALESSIIYLEMAFDHRLYLPSVGLILAAVHAASPWWPKIRWWRPATVAALATTLAWSTIARNRVWRDPETLWRDCVEKSPQKARPHYNLGHLYSGQGRYEEALALQHEAIGLDPEYSDAYNNIGFILSQQGRIPESLPYFRGAVKFKEDHWEAHLNLGSALSKLKQYGESFKHFARSLELNPYNAETYSNYGTTLMDAGQPQAALEQFNAAVRLDSDAFEAKLGIGNALTALNRTDEAINYLQRLTTSSAGLDRVYNAIGITEARRGRYREAAAAFEQAVAAAPSFVDGYFNLGNACRDSGQPEQALANYARAAELEPGKVRAHLNAGKLLFSLGRLTEAIAAYDRALAQAPDFAEACYQRGLAHFQAKSAETALADFRRVTELSPKHRNAWLFRGHCNYELRNWQAAVDAYDQTLAIDPRLATAHNNAAAALIQLGRVKEAIGRYEQALAIDPNYQDARSNLELARAKLQQQDQQ